MGDPCFISSQVSNLPASRLKNDKERKVHFFIPSPGFEQQTYKTASRCASSSATPNPTHTKATQKWKFRK
jgi:hypothetical protein